MCKIVHRAAVGGKPMGFGLLVGGVVLLVLSAVFGQLVLGVWRDAGQG